MECQRLREGYAESKRVSMAKKKAKETSEKSRCDDNISIDTSLNQKEERKATRLTTYELVENREQATSLLFSFFIFLNSTSKIRLQVLCLRAQIFYFFGKFSIPARSRNFALERGGIVCESESHPTGWWSNITRRSLQHANKHVASKSVDSSLPRNRNQSVKVYFDRLMKRFHS